MPVGLGLGHDFTSHHAARARTVIDHHRLAQVFRKLLAHRTGRQIGHAARTKGHHDADGLTRVRLGPGLGDRACPCRKPQQLNDLTAIKHAFHLDVE